MALDVRDSGKPGKGGPDEAVDDLCDSLVGAMHRARLLAEALATRVLQASTQPFWLPRRATTVYPSEELAELIAGAIASSDLPESAKTQSQEWFAEWYVLWSRALGAMTRLSPEAAHALAASPYFRPSYTVEHEHTLFSRWSGVFRRFFIGHCGQQTQASIVVCSEVVLIPGSEVTYGRDLEGIGYVHATAGRCGAPP